MTKKLKAILVGSVVVFAAVIFGTTAARTLFYYPDPEAPTPGNLPVYVENSSSSLPARFAIPSLNVDASIQYLGVNSKGNMQAPSNFTDVGWYKYGPVPGALGSAVIDGHVDNGLGLDGVFKHLVNLKVGDDIYVTAKDGSVSHFVVSDVELYPYTSVPSEKIFNATDTAHLNLITCDGAWVNGQDTYDHRLVIYSVLKERTNTTSTSK